MIDEYSVLIYYEYDKRDKCYNATLFLWYKDNMLTIIDNILYTLGIL